METKRYIGLCCAAIGMAGMCAGLSAQTPGGGPGTAPSVKPQQRLNNSHNAEAATNQPPDGSYDPLAFYRKNPELMKRYFPHLYQSGVPLPPGQGMPHAPVQPDLLAQSAGRESLFIDSFQFGGGRAGDFVEQLRAQFKPEPNIMIAPKLRDIEIPEFELKNVTLADLFQALNNLSEDKSVQWQLSGSTEPIWVLTPTGLADGGGGTAASFGARYGMLMGSTAGVDPLTGMPILSKNNDRTCQILPLGKFLGRYKVEDITTAVKTAWGMMGDDAGAQLKYHTDTKLLIAVGTNEQLSILSQVLSSLDTGLKQDLPDGVSGAGVPGTGKAPEATKKF